MSFSLFALAFVSVLLWRHIPSRFPSLIPLATGSLAVVLFLLPPASLCGSLRLRGSRLSPPTSQLSIKPLRDCCFAVDALVPRAGSLQRRALLTMRIGFSFARYFFFTCSAEMSVSLFTGCVHPHKVRVVHRGLGLGTTIAYQMSSASLHCCVPLPCAFEAPPWLPASISQPPDQPSGWSYRWCHKSRRRERSSQMEHADER